MISLHRVFTLYLTWGTFSLVCNLSVFFYFLLLFCFFYRYFSRQVLTIHWIAGKGEGIIIFLVFNFHPLTNFQLVHWDFYHFFLLKLIVIPRMIAYETCFPGRFAFFFCIFIYAITSELLTLTFQSDIMRIWAHIKLSPFYCKTNSLTNWDLHH